MTTTTNEVKTFTMVGIDKEYTVKPDSVFNRAWEKATPVDFSTEWKNSTGYLDGLVSADLGGTEGDVFRTVDDHNRAVLIVVTRFGNVVLFERYTSHSGTYVVNRPSELRAFIKEGAQTESDIAMIAGCGNPNIGQSISHLFEANSRL